MKEIVFAIIGSSALFSFIQYLLSRRDNKKNIEKKLGDKIDGVSEEVKNVSVDIREVSERLEEHKATLARTHILRFADEQRSGTIHHSKEYFEQQILDIDTYEKYCDAHPEFKNGLTVMASKYIKDEYKKIYLSSD